MRLFLATFCSCRRDTGLSFIQNLLCCMETLKDHHMRIFFAVIFLTVANFAYADASPPTNADPVIVPYNQRREK